MLMMLQLLVHGAVVGSSRTQLHTWDSQDGPFSGQILPCGYARYMLSR